MATHRARSSIKTTRGVAMAPVASLDLLENPCTVHC
jgi:hypothetical protein